ncbi:uroporphyrinogen-III synthase [Calothrix sp. NIES-4071]|nr:uroporphyrinogen-III synthase [Calothrix sp. NIES-4071]BAZ55820.1 uroporphyrinogen-III synthase [Calothrix sp. NIES-4105]
MYSKLPLYGKRIIITAPRVYAVRLSQALINQGALPLFMPTIETNILEDFTVLDEHLAKINTYDSIAFTSRNGIDAVSQRMRKLKIDTSMLQQVHLSAIGKDAELLETLGAEVDVVPTEPSPTGIIHELAKISDIAGKNILVPVPEVIGIPEPDVIPNFLAGLSDLGMNVTPVIAYQTRSLDKSMYNVELDLIRQGKVDVIAFSSSAEVSAFKKMFDNESDYQKTLIACFGPYTGANARNLGLNVSIIADDFSSFDGFATAITNYFN